MMKSSLDHIPHRKQRELARALEILHEEFEDALGECGFHKVVDRHFSKSRTPISVSTGQ